MRRLAPFALAALLLLALAEPGLPMRLLLLFPALALLGRWTDGHSGDSHEP